ncbi:MAG: pyridoxamine 5'-phosphate oxidase [Bacteroidota bacterium]
MANTHEKTTAQLEQLRKDYSSARLDEDMVGSDPIAFFKQWFNEALEAGVPEPSAVCLSTANQLGIPSGRMVLLKGIEAGGFNIYTNYNSRKGQELAENPYAAITAFWAELERQVRIEGRVEKLSRERSEAYFKSRPEGSRIGAWASPQSETIGGREQLEHLQREYEQKFAGEEIPIPEHWGGYRVQPTSIEFWQGRPSRLHDRLRFRKAGGGWQLARLAP